MLARRSDCRLNPGAQTRVLITWCWPLPPIDLLSVVPDSADAFLEPVDVEVGAVQGDDVRALAGGDLTAVLIQAEKSSCIQGRCSERAGAAEPCRSEMLDLTQHLSVWTHRIIRAHRDWHAGIDRQLHRPAMRLRCPRRVALGVGLGD